jgi:zinc and cadmium transporter
MTAIVFTGLFVPIVLLGLSVYLFQISNRNLKLIVAFSGAFLISLTFNELIPHIFSGEVTHETVAQGGHQHEDFRMNGEQDHSSEETHHHSTPFGLFILLGFLLQLILDYLTKGVEHGHMHSKCPENHEQDHQDHHHEEDRKGVSHIPVVIGLALHSFLEAMPLASGFESAGLQNKLLLGIVIHNIPIAIVLMGLLMQNKVSRLLSVVWLLVFALAGPLGVIASDMLGSHLIGDMHLFFKFSMSIVVGIFLHIATTILFETDENHRFNLLKFAVIILGGAAAMIHF